MYVDMRHAFTILLLLLPSSVFSNAFVPVGSASELLIPAAGSTAGANGTFFRSDITIINLADRDQLVSVTWLPEVNSGSVVQPQIITVPAGSRIRSLDFVNEYLHTSGLGSIIVVGITAANAPDPNAMLNVASRIWTGQAGTDGTVSQSFPAIPMNTIDTPAAMLFGFGSMEHPERFRLNIGIVNVSSAEQAFAIGPFPSSSPVPFYFDVTIPPLSMQQFSFGCCYGNLPKLVITNISDQSVRSNRWVAYDSNVDNVSGDAWSELAVPIAAPAP